MTTERNIQVLDYPLLPLRGQIVFPTIHVPLEVGRERSIRALEEAQAGDRRMILAMQKDTRADDPQTEDIYEYGTLVEIKQIVKVPGNIRKVVFEGIARAKIVEYLDGSSHFRVRAEVYPEEAEKTPELEAMMRSLVTQYEEFIKTSKKVPPEALINVVQIEDPGRLADNIAHHMALKNVEDKQVILETLDVRDRLEKVSEMLAREVELIDLERKINVRVRKQMEKTQKEYYLREQIKAIQKELGERDDNKASETEDMRAKVEKLGLPDEVKEKVLKEVDRLEKMPPMAAEAVVVRNYLEWMTSLPWSVMTDDQIDLDKAEGVLDHEHFGMQKVKDRILEYLAIRALVDKMKGPILCLVGPPGVGKTSLAKSIANSIGRKFVRASLGGVRDEAEIRGHRRTYVGAMPGRIIQGMRQAGSKNPVFLLDEIDKMSSDFRGDPSAALLEVLDPEQNNTFSDHYIESPYDLSDVMFITTANVLWNIPRPLMDRMEVITLSGYTEDEKLEICKRHLLPKQMKDHGLAPEKLEVSDNTLLAVIREHTREAGVRSLERTMAALCRKAAKEIVKGETQKVRITTQNLEKYLGAPRFRWNKAEQQDQVGIVTGLSVSEAGGDVMPIEVMVMKGKGNLLLTGKLGDVMRESAQAGFSYIRSRAKELGIDEEFHTKYDIHIHVPEGAIPKDGPSAGLAMATAVVSALTGRAVRKDVAMTGEVTLRGRALPIGGVKEKLMAAHRAGITTAVLPKQNEKDLEDLPPNVRRKLDIHLVDHMDDVLKIALVPETPKEDQDMGIPPTAMAGEAPTLEIQDGGLPT